MADILQTFSQTDAGFKVWFFGLLIACLIHIVGFATVQWSTDKNDANYMGLWRLCRCYVTEIPGKDECNCDSFREEELPAWFKSVRAMETLGLTSIVFAICSGVRMLFTVRHQRRSIQIISILLTWGAGVCILIGVVLYAAKLFNGFTTGYSFVLCCLSGSICMVLALMMSINALTCGRPGDDATDTLTTTLGVSSEPPATVCGQISSLRDVGIIEQPGYDQPGNDPPRYEQVRIDRPRRQPRAYSQRKRTQYTAGGFLAGLPSRGVNSPPAYTPGDYYRSGQQTTVIANAQNAPEGNTTVQPPPYNMTENLCNRQRAPEKQSDRPPPMADTPSSEDTIGQCDGTTNTHDC